MTETELANFGTNKFKVRYWIEIGYIQSIICRSVVLNEQTLEEQAAGQGKATLFIVKPR